MIPTFIIKIIITVNITECRHNKWLVPSSEAAEASHFQQTLVGLHRSLQMSRHTTAVQYQMYNTNKFLKRSTCQFASESAVLRWRQKQLWLARFKQSVAMSVLTNAKFFWVILFVKYYLVKKTCVTLRWSKNNKCGVFMDSTCKPLLQP